MSASTASPVERSDPQAGAEPLGGLGRPIKGPSALGSEPRRLWQLTWALAKTEFKLAFFGSVLGYLWQLMRPLLLFGVIFGVISLVAKGLGKGLPFYPVSVLLGIVLFTFYSESTGGSVTCLILRENLVRKIDFPRLAVPLSTVMTALLNVSLNLVPVIVFLLATGGSVQASWLELPLLVLLLAAFATGLGMILSIGYVYYRDVRPIWDVVLQMTFYASPIFYPITSVEKNFNVLGLDVNFAHLMMANPFVAILVQARHVLIAPSYPTAASAIGGTPMLLIPIGIGIAVFATGFLLFDRQAPRVAEQL
ncbi:MAG TPA: ABC transporter permease [Solirubrobacteraceae bacterium]|jgi:ABC-2 type transport system permease protein|nr:ABC transporter permease [Solirubrobacteraceae bacterium]